MATFKRHGNAAERSVKRILRRQKIAKKLAAFPAVELHTTATTTTNKTSPSKRSRTEVENIIIYRTHAKRLGAKRMRLTAADVKRITMAARDLRRRMLDGDVRSLRTMLTKVGTDMRYMIRRKVLREGLIATGQLYRSIVYSLENV